MQTFLSPDNGFFDIVQSQNVREVSEIVDVYICQEIGMFHIARDRNV